MLSRFCVAAEINKHRLKLRAGGQREICETDTRSIIIVLRFAPD